MYIERVSVTDKAKIVIEQLREKHGELIFHQSGGCCDGSAPMCLAKGDFLIGARDLCLGEIHGCNFYMASDQFEYYKNMHITIDVSEGRGSSFSLEIPLGIRFMVVSRLFIKVRRNIHHFYGGGVHPKIPPSHLVKWFKGISARSSLLNF